MLDRDGYPAGVPCWVDLIQPDLDATMAFYRDLFGWAYEIRTPDGAPQRYAYARLDGLVVAGLGGPRPGDRPPSGWTSYVWVDSVDDAARAVEANGGRVLEPRTDIGPAGRSALCADPAGAVFGLWQAAGNRGAQLVNAPGSWNFSVLETADAAGVEAFYRAVFGWELGVSDGFGMWRLAGYGDFLAEHDPEIRERHAAGHVPAGFADVVAALRPVPAGAHAHWSITFAVADADAAFARAIDAGATAVTPLFDTPYTRQGTVSDPQGAVLTLSEYRPPSG